MTPIACFHLGFNVLHVIFIVYTTRIRGKLYLQYQQMQKIININ